MKKLLITLLCVIMIMAFMPIVTFAASAMPAAVDGVITLTEDVTLTETYHIPVGEKVTLDLNGHTVSMNMTATATKNHTMILNEGDLTIQDSVGGGKLSYKYTGGSLGTTYSANTVTSNPKSTLTIKSGTIENLTYDSAVIAYAVDGLTNGTIGDVTVSIEGGKITSLRQAVRMFANSTTHTATLNISGGEFVGRVIVQSSNAHVNKAVLNITGGTFNVNEYKTEVLYVGGSSGANMDMTVSISGGDFNGGVISSVSDEEYITGGTFAESAKAEIETKNLIADGYQMIDDGTVECNHAETEIVNQGATCGEAGVEGKEVCKKCGKTVKEGTVVEATGDHNYVGGVCTVCQQEEPAGDEGGEGTTGDEDKTDKDPVDKEDDKEEPKKDVPKTSDIAGMLPWIAMMAVTALAAVMFKKKEN